MDIHVLYQLFLNSRKQSKYEKTHGGEIYGCLWIIQCGGWEGLPLVVLCWFLLVSPCAAAPWVSCLAVFRFVCFV